jgi:hypothetical protein
MGSSKIVSKFDLGIKMTKLFWYPTGLFDNMDAYVTEFSRKREKSVKRARAFCHQL